MKALYDKDHNLITYYVSEAVVAHYKYNEDYYILDMTVCPYCAGSGIVKKKDIAEQEREFQAGRTHHPTWPNHYRDGLD